MIFDDNKLKSLLLRILDIFIIIWGNYGLWGFLPIQYYNIKMFIRFFENESLEKGLHLFIFINL